MLAGIGCSLRRIPIKLHASRLLMHLYQVEGNRATSLAANPPLAAARVHAGRPVDPSLHTRLACLDRHHACCLEGRNQRSRIPRYPERARAATRSAKPNPFKKKVAMASAMTQHTRAMLPVRVRPACRRYATPRQVQAMGSPIIHANHHACAFSCEKEYRNWLRAASATESPGGGAVHK